MCGLVGVWHRDGRCVDPAVVERMRAVQAHRGPDDRGLRLFSLRRGASVGFRSGELPRGDPSWEGAVGFNRLSIQDLSELGHQPMASDDGGVFLAFNGEIYNAPELRRGLEARGVAFRSRSDTEVILRLYQERGLEETLDQLTGMFAICIVDLRRRELLLARDPLGVKPLYWTECGNTLLFSSEVKSFLLHPDFKAELDPARVDECLMFRFCADGGPPLAGVHELRPGHLQRWTAASSTQRAYWSIPDGSVTQDLSLEEATDRFSEALEGSVLGCLLSDVKVGCQLSGGIDSSVITVLARKHFEANLETFSVVFQEERFSEDRWISRAAAVAGADSHRFTLRSDYVIDHLATATWHLDQPINVPNSVGIFYLAERSRPIVTVLLSGEGADEMAGGYNRFHHAATRSRLRPWLPLLERLPGLGRRYRKRYGDPGERDPVEWYLRFHAFLQPEQLHALRPGAEVAGMLERRRQIFSEGKGDYLKNCLRYDLRTWLVDLLIRQDKMTMAHSVENRVPFLDHRLVSFVRSLPASYLVHPTWGGRRARAQSTKRILKRVAERYFEPDFLYRPKRGFGLPFGTYYRHPRFVQLMEEKLLPGMRSRDCLRADRVEQWWRRESRDPRGWDLPIWTAIAFEIWAQEFVDGGWRRRAS